MPDWFPSSVFGAVLALCYVVLAVAAVISDRASTGGGTWISLKGMATFLVTFPVSALGELLGMAPDFRRNRDMIFVITVCAIGVYFLGIGLARLVRVVWPGGGGA